MLKWRECDSDSVKLLGIGKKILSLCVVFIDLLCLLQKDPSRKFEFLGDCPPYFNVCANLEKQESN